jgi:hypothetical protein
MHQLKSSAFSFFRSGTLKTTLCAALVLGFAACAMVTSVRADTIGWGAAFDAHLVDSHGATLTTGFTFQLGGFVPGFDPKVQPASAWASNWRVFDQADYATSFTDDADVFHSGLSYFTGTETMNTNGTSNYAGPGATATDFRLIGDAYIWIFNDKAMTQTTEWFLGRASNWTFPTTVNDCCPGALVEWDAIDLTPANTPVFGAQSGVKGAGVYSTPMDPAVIQTFTFGAATTLY